MFTVADLKFSVSGILQGINLDNVTDLNGAIERAARITVQQADVPEASGIQTYNLYNQVYDYPAPDTIFGGAINDLRPQGVVRTPSQYAYKQPIELFDRTKAFLPNGVAVTFEYRSGTGIMRVSSPIPREADTLDPMSSTDGWVVAGTASGLVLDQTNYYHTPASLRFSQTVGIGTLTKTINSTDLSVYDNVGVAFLAINTPSATNLTSIELRIGSSPTDYNAVTNTTGFVGAWIANDWLLVPFDFAGSPDTGSPNWSAIDYVQVRVTSAGTLTNFRTGDLFIGLSSPFELLFQSAAVFMPTGTTVPSRTIFLDTDNILFNDAAYTIFQYECAKEIYLQSGGGMADAMYQTIENKLQNPDTGLYNKYRANNPSAQLRSVDSYYD